MKRWKIQMIILLCGLLFFPKSLVLATESENNAELELEQMIPCTEECLFEDGDVVGFIGDSITQVSYSKISYEEFLYHYYITRYPNWKLEFRNLGIGFYTAEYALKLYGGEYGITDKSLEGINKAVIMFGMNEALNGIEPSIYIENIQKLVELLNKQGIKNENMILVAPTPFDQTRSSNYRENGELRETVDNFLLEYTKELKNLAQRLGVHYIDLHTPMLWITEKLQAVDQNATFTIEDNVHPKAEGNILAGFFFLYQQGAGKTVANVRIAKGEDTQADNAAIESVKWRGRGSYVCFQYQPYSLPMATLPEFLQASTYFGMEAYINQEKLQVEGLQLENDYTIYMDDIPVGVFTGKQLEQGVNLADCDWNLGQLAAREIEGLNQKWQEASSEYREVLRMATLGERNASQEDVDMAYEIWREETTSLENGMYQIAQNSVKRSFKIEVVSENGRMWARLERWRGRIIGGTVTGLLFLTIGIVLFRRRGFIKKH